MDRANSYTKSYNIPRPFEAMYINSIKYELRAWVTCDYFSPEQFCLHFEIHQSRKGDVYTSRTCPASLIVVQNSISWLVC